MNGGEDEIHTLECYLCGSLQGLSALVGRLGRYRCEFTACMGGNDCRKLLFGSRRGWLLSCRDEDGSRIRISARFAGLLSRMDEDDSRIKISAGFAADSVTIEFGR